MIYFKNFGNMHNHVDDDILHSTLKSLLDMSGGSYSTKFPKQVIYVGIFDRKQILVHYKIWKYNHYIS